MNTSNITAIVVAIVLILIGSGIVIFTLSNRPISTEGAVATQQSGNTFPNIDDYDVPERAVLESGEPLIPYDPYEPPNQTESFFNPNEDYVSEVVYDNTAPALSNIEIDDGVAETNTAAEEREELREETPRPQALPQPVQETLVETEIQVDEEVVPTVSKYLGMVTMNGSGAKREASEENIVLQASSKNEKNVTITGWKFRSAITGKEVPIEKAERAFVSGSSASKEPIVLEPRGKVTFLTTSSPVGFSFTVNLCSGYLNQFNDFTPRVSSKCPSAEDEILFYDGDQSIFIDNDCMDFVERIRKCEIVENEDYTPDVSPQCREAIIENVGYNVCVQRHQNEEGFYHLDQRVYLARGVKIWREEREIIELIDEDGFIVDFVEY